jgi:hypothetical protein
MRLLVLLLPFLTSSLALRFPIPKTKTGRLPMPLLRTFLRRLAMIERPMSLLKTILRRSVEVHLLVVLGG